MYYFLFYVRQLLFHESTKTKIPAGLLTYSIFESPSRSLHRTVDLRFIQRLLAELTAAGLFRTFT